MRTAIPTTALLLTLAFAGCGGPPAQKPRRARNSPSGPVALSDGSTSGTETATRTRAATLGRRGNWNLTADKVQAVAPLVREHAAKNGLPEDLVYGLIWVESRYNPEAVSPVGARGLMQLMPATARWLAGLIGWPDGDPDSFDPAFNIAAGTYYLKRLIVEFDGDVDVALGAYNAGPGNVSKWLREDGVLPRVSIEYATMVQTARGFFGQAAGTPAGSPSPGAPVSAPQVIASEGLDRLGLAILLAGLDATPIGADRPDDPHPLD